MCIKCLKSKLEVIQKLKPPKSAKDCKSFPGVVNYLSIFCPAYQMLLKSIFHLIRKYRPFIWTTIQQNVFEEIKTRMLHLPVFHLPDNRERFQLFSDTSKTAAGYMLYPI